MKKSRVEDIFLEEARNRESEDEFNDDTKNIKIIDLTDEIEEEERYSHKDNAIKRVIGDWYNHRVEFRKNKKSKKKFKKLRRFIAIVISSIVITMIVVIVWNTAQMKKIDDVVQSINDSYSAQELNIDAVRNLGHLFTIHDKESYDYCINNIRMDSSLRGTLFTVNSEGQYAYTGTDDTGENIPTYELVELQYERGTDPLSYLANFKVTLSNGNIRYYLVMCKFRVQDGKTVLTGLNIY